MSAQKGKILVVDDEAGIRRILQTRLEIIGYSVVTASDGEEALSAFRLSTPDLIVLDVMMPKLDGYGVCQQLRRESNVPIIMLTALADVADRIVGLELGADDYMTKPFSPKELEARIASILRRRSYKTDINIIPNSGIIHVGDLKIDTSEGLVHKNEQRIRLTGIEFSLLELLVSHSGKVFSRLEILQELWGLVGGFHTDTRVVDVHISRLRTKVESDPNDPEFIITARGSGYFFPRIIDSEQ
ncbi:response regulator transcription factor [Nostoc flagelliforme FACHB-838]|uniref:Probable transcriptional regulator ycf27 n=1 Tax=Nostoc flagelliforme FACHB-838 TaxID=2692904 RepID=A0ABR8E8D7_9NOSO|nr:response regulator transcription factor [Nostoc flagelliforme]MBD2536775.1 response regulator transcription factor [Nostoc flagelliforme FACHB-838]